MNRTSGMMAIMAALASKTPFMELAQPVLRRKKAKSSGLATVTGAFDRSQRRIGKKVHLGWPRATRGY